MTPIPKPRPRLFDRVDYKRQREAVDRAESLKAKQRAHGQCEVVIAGVGRCPRKDVQTHHLLGGWGLRARGKSALAEHKQRVCVQHHALITGHALILVRHGLYPVWSDPYETWTP